MYSENGLKGRKNAAYHRYSSCIVWSSILAETDWTPPLGIRCASCSLAMKCCKDHQNDVLELGSMMNTFVEVITPAV